MMIENEPRVTWGDDGWANSDGWAHVYCTNKQSCEYTGPADVWVSVGTGLPAGSYLDSPPREEDGKAIVRTIDGWVKVPDYRGVTAYNKQTGLPVIVDEFGELPFPLTLLEPPSRFCTWNEESGSWEKNDLAEQQYMTAQAEQKKTALLAEATIKLDPIQDAVDIGMATPLEENALLEWKRYRILLTRVDVTKNPIDWPPSP